MKLDIMIMSGVEDGLRLTYDTENGDGKISDTEKVWKISIGRREDSDMCMRNDTFISRLHAYVIWEAERWWLEDCGSTNGTFIERDDSDAGVKGTIPIEPGQLFRVGHTWMRIEEMNN